MSGDNYTQTADDALAEVMGETPDSPSEPAEDVFDAFTDDTSPVSLVPDSEAAVEPLCDEETARGLVKQVQDALEQFDNGIQKIIRLRAWEPLGYASPREFVLAEFGPSDDPDAGGRVSRVHAYRLARLAMFMYGLSTRLGDEAAALDISERALRSLPSGQGGENDLVVLDRLEQRMAELGHPASKEEAEQALGDLLSEARSELAEHGSLRTKDDDWDEDFDDDRLASLSIDPDDLAADSTGVPEDPDGFDLNDLTDAPANPEPDSDSTRNEEQGASRNDLMEAYGSTETSEEAVENTQRLGELLRGMQAVADVEALLPQIVDYADEQELASLAELASRTVKVAEALVQAADQSGEMFTDGDY